MSTAVGEQVNSPTYALQAGMEYYFEVRCREGTLNEYFQIGVYIDETVYTAEQTSKYDFARIYTRSMPSV